MISTYLQEFIDFPPLTQTNIRLLDQALDDLTGQLYRFNVRVHPEGRNTVAKGTIIDAEVIDINS